MRSLFLVCLAAGSLNPAQALAAQQASPRMATLQLADGTSVALLEWTLSYDYLSWRKGDRVSNAKAQTQESPALLLGKKSFPLSGETLEMTHREDRDSFRVDSMSLRVEGKLKIEAPGKELLAPDLGKDFLYQPRSLDISGKTLSGITRSFCIVSFSALVDCGRSETTRVVRIEFNEGL